MKIRSIHGYFIFEEEHSGEVSEFQDLFQVELESIGPHFTFSDLVDAPDYSISGGLYLGAPATKTFAGPPWEVMRENALVYDFGKGLVVPLLSITTVFKLQSASNYFLADGMIQPGSITEDGSRVTDYAAFYIPDRFKFKYSEVGSE